MKRRLIPLLGLVLALFGFVQAGHALTLAEIRTAIRRNVRDTATSTTLQRYSDTVLNSYINEGQRDFVNQTWALLAQGSQSLSASTTYYSLRSDAYAIRLVRFRNSVGQVRELTEVSERALIQQNPDYERQSGAPMQYFVRYSTSGASAMEMGFVPAPNSSNTGTVLVDYYIQATDLSADSDIPYNGFRILYPYHDALVYFVSGRLKTLEGDDTRAAAYTAIYGNYVKTAIDILGRMPNYHPGFSAASK